MQWLDVTCARVSPLRSSHGVKRSCGAKISRDESALENEWYKLANTHCALKKIIFEGVLVREVFERVARSRVVESW